MKIKKRIAVIISEYWDISHADVLITKMLDGFRMDGRPYESSLDIVTMYIDQFPKNDMGREMAAKHQIPLWSTIRETLLLGKDSFDLDGIILIGEHGVYPDNKYGQTLYPRRRFFEECLNVMLEFARIVPVYSDKGFAVIQEDIEWMYRQIKKHNIPFMSGSSVPQVPRYPIHEPFPNGAPLFTMFGFAYGSFERYIYHTMEMMQSIAENRAYGETGIRAVNVIQGEEAIGKVFTAQWERMYRKLGGFLNLRDIDQFPYSLKEPAFITMDYCDGMQAGILFVDWLKDKPEVQTFASAYQVLQDEEPICLEFRLQAQKPYIHFGRYGLEIERFLHTGRPLYPVERSLLTSGALDACMRSVHEGREIETPYLEVRY